MRSGEFVQELEPEPAGPERAFDFAAHRRSAIQAYQDVQRLYEDYATTVRSILSQMLVGNKVQIHSIEARAKSLESFGHKVETAATEDPSRPKYPSPLQDITDLAGVRVIVFFLNDLTKVDQLIKEQFDIVEVTNKSQLLEREEKLGYQSVHYIVRFKASRSKLPEYVRFTGLLAEVQVRTILQHAWAEIEHDIQYKSIATLPRAIRRRFMTLAGLLEIADREFQAISDEEVKLRLEARQSVDAGRLKEVEITPDALKAYLDKKYGPDRRVAEWTYGWMAGILEGLGFTDIEQVDKCVSQYNDDRISRIIWGSRMGQVSRFEDVLLAGMGEEYIMRHPWYGDDDNFSGWFEKSRRDRLSRLRAAGIRVGLCSPAAPSRSLA